MVAIEVGKSPNLVVLSRCNKAFFDAALVSEMQSVVFEEAVYNGQHHPTEYSFEHAGYLCHMLVDASKLCGQESFQTNFHKAINHVARSIPGAVSGELNERVMIDYGPYRFQFDITRYWSCKSPDDDLVEDPALLPVGECLGREVELRIGFAV